MRLYLSMRKQPARTDVQKLVKANKQRLRKLGLPDNFFEEDFWEKELRAREQEQLVYAWFEAHHAAGYFEGSALDMTAILATWKTAMEHPLHFASSGDRPYWYDIWRPTRKRWLARSSGKIKEYERKNNANRNKKAREQSHSGDARP